MKLEESDIAIIQEVLTDYQDFIRATVEKSMWTGIPMSPRFWHPYKVLRTKITVYLPLVQAALRGELPRGFVVLAMHDSQYLAWCTDHAYSIGTHGPTTLFQAILWCQQQHYLRMNVQEAEVAEVLQ